MSVPTGSVVYSLHFVHFLFNSVNVCLIGFSSVSAILKSQCHNKMKTFFFIENDIESEGVKRTKSIQPTLNQASPDQIDNKMKHFIADCPDRIRLS